MQEAFEKIIEKLEDGVSFSKLNEMERRVGGKQTKGFCIGVCFAKEIVNEVAEEYNNGWIPCSERLPNKEEFLKAYIRNKYGAEFIVMIEGANRPTTLYLTSDGLWVDDCRNAHEVIAWKPLPEPYHPKGE